ncbi:MAG TPA: CDP-alcohol phosphatidyltransferase family protein [Anaerolineae bacterium]|nr:CDP-alcohol phosphatidyltransferase family protein [Anaerolineae bacterium]
MVTIDLDAREPELGHSLAQLRRRWWLVVGLYVLAAALSYGLLRSIGLAEPAWRWALPVTLAMGYTLTLLRRGLPDNRRRGETALFPRLGLANAVTLLRGCLMGILAGFLLFPRPPGGLAWLPALVYTAAALTDFVDGYLARVTDQPTLLGERLDMELDSLGALLAFSLAVAYGQLQAWALLMGLAHYLFVGALAWRTWRGLPVYDLSSSMHGRIVAALYMGFVAVVLWPVLDPAATRFAAIWFALPLAASFGRDWLVVSGRVDPASPAYRAALGRLQRLLTRRLPVLLRVLAVICFLWLAGTALRAPGGLVETLHWPGVLTPQASATLIMALGLVGVVLTLFGLEARLGALLLIFPAGASISTGGLNLANGLLVASAITLLHTGGGDWSLWRPSDRLFLQRLGRPRK